MSESGLMEGWGQTPPKERCPIGLLVSAAAWTKYMNVCIRGTILLDDCDSANDSDSQPYENIPAKFASYDQCDHY